MKIISLTKHILKVLSGKETVKFEQKVKNNSFRIEDLLDLEDNNRKLEEEKLKAKLVVIDGCGFGGSSAITDFLAEFSSCSVFGGVAMDENPERGIEQGFEADFFRQPKGVLDLEKICNTSVGGIRDIAIHDFLNVVQSNYSSGILLYDDYYLEQSLKFVNELLAYKIKYYSTYIYVPKKITVKDYRALAKKYLISVLNHIIIDKEFLVLDNLMAICEPNVELLKDYFGDFKMLYGWSDPRDVYARARIVPGGNDWVPVDPDIFIKFFKNELPLYLKSTSNNILCVRFDDFVNEYDIIADKIVLFLGLQYKSQIKKFKYFNPKVSINNTKLYLKLDNQQAIDYIHKELIDFCYK